MIALGELLKSGRGLCQAGVVGLFNVRLEKKRVLSFEQQNIHLGIRTEGKTLKHGHSGTV